ncbi:MAG: MipA/OmpV family protein [Pseudomonadota bacterium]
MSASRPALPLATAAIALLGPLAVTAQVPEEQGPRYDDFLALGAVSVPDYEGAADQQLVPLLFGQIRFAGNRHLAVQGTGLRLNVLDSRQWAAGPALNFGFGRDDGVANEAIARLREVDTAIEAGAFIDRTWSQVGHPTATLSVGVAFGQDLANAHEGWHKRS